MLQQAIRRILAEYPGARSQPFEDNGVASFVREDAAEAVRAILATNYPELKVKGSAGNSKWADVPWIGIFDPKITDSATRGYYLVYLFNFDGSAVHLSINQGATAVREEFKAKAPEILAQRAALMRRRLSDFSADFAVNEIRLRSDNHLPRDYEAGHALGTTYFRNAIPSDAELEAHLVLAAKAYLSLEFRGGLDPSLEASSEIEDEVLNRGSLVEVRRYRMHRRIERNPRASADAKRLHGTSCQACGLDFKTVYGEIGEGFIEAHHLKALSTLEEGKSTAYDVRRDFAVLCSNCHRMIHRTEDPSDLASFVALLKRGP